MLKHYTQRLQTIQEYETTNKTKISGYHGHQPMEIDQINGFKGKKEKKGKGKSKGPPVKGKGK
eukprot:3187294-Amphidinium_carterae.1